jgi:hypothetical protein
MAVANPELQQTILQKYDVPEGQIKLLDKKYELLVEITDTKSYNTFMSALAEYRAIRLNVEDRRKELKKYALEYGRTVDTEAKRIQALIEPGESRLKMIKDAWDEKKKAEKLAQRYADEIRAYWDEAHEENRQVDERKAEELRLEQQRIEQEKREEEIRRKEEEIARKEREEKIRQQAIEAGAREERQRQEIEKQRKETEEAERKRQAELAPDQEKLAEFIKILQTLPYPAFQTDELQQVLKTVKEKITEAVRLLENLK